MYRGYSNSGRLSEGEYSGPFFSTRNLKFATSKTLVNFMKKMMFLSKNWYFSVQKALIISRRPTGPVREIIKCPLSVRACVRSSRFYRSLSISKTIIARASKFAGYINHWKNLPGNLFLLILKNKMAATGVNKMAAVDFFSTLLIAQNYS